MRPPYMTFYFFIYFLFVGICAVIFFAFEIFENVIVYIFQF